MITIGRLAEYAGVTVKAVRHYHERGLLAEPERDASGYRRYGADDAVKLIKIKALTGAGVPLARIQELLDADPAGFAEATGEIEAELRRRAEDLVRAADRVARLRSGDRLFVSEAAADLLDRLREIGVSARGVQLERDAWILLQAVSHADAAAWLADKADALEDPAFAEIYLAWDAAFDWDPADPRLEPLAERTEAWRSRRYGESGPAVADPDPAVLAATADGTSSPAWDRLAELVRRRRR